MVITCVASRVFTPTRHVYRTPKVVHPRNVRAHAFDAVESSRILGEAITAGVIFYTSLQYAHYRRIRLHVEDAKKTRDDKKAKAKEDAYNAHWKDDDKKDVDM
jgi:hypothetical protein